MAPWWSPLSDGIQRLVGHRAQPGLRAPDVPTTLAADVAPVRAPQAWPWQPPVQRAIDPAWTPRLNPDAFAAGLTSHQDPSFRRDLVHEVRPSTGGLVDGLADLVPGSPRTRQPTSELTVRPMRSARPEMQRSLASFASDDAGDELTTVEVEPPWLAEPDPVAAAEPVTPSEPAETAASVVPVPAGPRPPDSVPAGTPRDIRVQRHEVAAASPIVPTAPPKALDEDAVMSAMPAMPVAPTVARTIADRPTVSRAVSVEGARALPVVATPPPRLAPAELPTTRTLPVLQRSVGPSSSGALPVPSASEPSATAPPAPTAPAASAAPEPGETAPLSGFAEAIERLSVEPEPEPAPVQRAAHEPAVAGPVVPQGHTDVQREVTAEVSQAPLLGSHVEDVTPAPQPIAQRAAYDDLAVVPVARDVEPNQGWSAPDDVPRLPVATAASAFEPSIGSAAAPSDAASAPTSRPVVARVAAASTRTVPTVARAVETPIREVPRTAPLTGTRPTVVQRTGFAPPQSASSPPVERVQPLRYEGFAGGTTTQPSRPALPGTAPAGHTTEPSLQRSAGGFPAVAPGLVGPGPVGPGPVGPGPVGPGPVGLGSVVSGPVVPGPVAIDPVRAVPDFVFPALGSASVDLEAVTVNRSADQPGWSPPEPVAPRARAWAEQPPQPVQRLAAAAPTPAPTLTSPTALPTTARSLPFDQMFGGTGAPGTSDADAGWTTVDLPVVSDAPAVGERAAVQRAAVQRAVDTSAISAEPVAPEPVAPPPDVAAPPPPTAAASAAPAAAPAAVPGAADLDEMARRLFDPLSARLRAELWLDRERAGLVADAHF